MRELRAWDDVLGKMLYSKTEQFDDGLLYRFEQHFETDKPVYMWGTGQKDRNGKEIYESDILKISGRAIPQEVKFEEGCFGTNEFLLIELIRDKSRTIEVIGNIWEEQQ